jgi:hypothetical protein
VWDGRLLLCGVRLIESLCVAVTQIDGVRSSDTESRSRRVAVIAVVWALTAVPFLIVHLPPVMDVPNHLTRIWLLAGGLDHAPLSTMYAANWSQAATNIFVDMIGTGLARVLSIEAVGKVLLLAMFLTPPLAAQALHKKLFGQTGWWALAGVLLVWSTTAVTGLISFQISLAAALVSALLVHPIARPTWRRLLAIVACTTIILFIHPFGALFFMLLAIALVLGPEWAHFKGKHTHVAAAIAASVVPVALLMLLAPHPPGDNGTHQALIYWQPLDVTLSPTTIALVLLSPILSYKASLDVLLVLPVIAAIGWLAYRRQLKVHAGLMAMAGLLELVSPFLPMNIGDGGALVIRIPEMAALMALAGLNPTFETRRQGAMFAGVLAIVALARIGTIGWIWHMRDGDLQQLEKVSRSLPSGAAVMVLQQHWSETKGAPLGRLVAGFPSGRCASERHFGSLIVMWRQVFIPTLFTVPGQQPLMVKPAYLAKSVYSSGIPFTTDMNMPSRHLFDPYLNHWHQTFDYVLLLNADLGQTPLPGTRVIADDGFARLYQVVH